MAPWTYATARWLHAGVILDDELKVHQAWYTVHPVGKGNRIELSVGEAGKPAHSTNDTPVIDLIHFDTAIASQWLHCTKPDGSWKSGWGAAGKDLRRGRLLDLFNNPRYEDPYANGNTSPKDTTAPPVKAWSPSTGLRL